MHERLPGPVVHYARFDPRQQLGGVESFALRLENVFGEVLHMTPENRDEGLVSKEKLVVICDNDRVLDWPKSTPVIGFRHGLARRKFRAIPDPYVARLAFRQWRAARRKNTLWAACARWIQDASERLYGTTTDFVIYHPIDLEKFDGSGGTRDSNLILHDGRSEHKGRDLYPKLERAFPKFRFEALACKPEEVPSRLSSARAFLHLSRYEGNSIVCNEAMAMNLPCLFTRVGLMQDAGEAFDVAVVEVNDVFGREKRLVESVGRFLESLNTREFKPRAWLETHASPAQNRALWGNVVDTLRQRFDWRP